MEKNTMNQYLLVFIIFALMIGGILGFLIGSNVSTEGYARPIYLMNVTPPQQTDLINSSVAANKHDINTTENFHIK